VPADCPEPAPTTVSNIGFFRTILFEITVCRVGWRFDAAFAQFNIRY